MSPGQRGQIFQREHTIGTDGVGVDIAQQQAALFGDEGQLIGDGQAFRRDFIRTGQDPPLPGGSVDGRGSPAWPLSH